MTRSVFKLERRSVLPKNWSEFQQKLIGIHIISPGTENKSIDGSFNDILDHVENYSFIQYAGPQCYGGGGTAQKKCILEGGATAHTLLMGATVWGGDTTQY